MVDLRAIRREPEAARAALARRRDGSEERLDTALSLDARRRASVASTDVGSEPVSH